MIKKTTLFPLCVRTIDDDDDDGDDGEDNYDYDEL